MRRCTTFLQIEIGYFAKTNMYVGFFADYYDLAYPGVIMRILLTRKMSYHLMQTYVPSTIFVSLAWLSIFIPPEQVPGKYSSVVN